MGCLFCKIVRKEIDSYCIYENDLTMAFLDVYPLSNAHCLLITKRHFRNMYEIDNDSWLEILPSLKIVVDLIEKNFSAKGFNFISNMNEISYQSVFHFHLHIIPKYQKDLGFVWNSLPDNSNKINLQEVYNKLIISN